jgi:adenine/guanine/hypoxanthine permease
VLTYFGFMHGEAVGIGGGVGVTPSVALAYAVVAALLFAFSRAQAVEPAAMPVQATAVPAE